MLCEDRARERLDFTERDGSHSGSFEAKRETANSAKEVKDIQCSFSGC